MKNVTITLDEKVAQWARVEAAKAGKSVSRFVGDLLAERRAGRTGEVAAALQGQKEAMEAFLSVPARALGFRYVGPVNGHSVPALLDALAEAKAIDGPVLIHAQTKKGKGYKYAEDEPVEYHGPSPFDPVAGIQKAKSTAAPAYTSVFGKAIVKLAEHDPRIVAITASMPDGTGLVPFSQKFPDRFLNTGIAEQHSVTLAGGLALGGVKPVVAIYSTFLQRGFDQIFHDVCLMDAPVVFAMDRGGIADSSVQLQGLDTGKYYWRVAAVDKEGVEGAYSEFARFTVVRRGGPGNAGGPPPPLAIQELELRTNILQIKGRTEPGATVTVNGQRVDVQSDGSFNEFITLDKPGRQMVVVRSTGLAGGVNEQRRQVVVAD